MSPLRACLSAILATTCLATAGCRWQPKTPVVVAPYPSDPAPEVFETALTKARDLGYRAYEVDESRRFATFFANYGALQMAAVTPSGALLAPNTNYLMMSVEDDGRIRAWASGPDVRGDKIDKHLAFELEVFANRVAGRNVEID